MATKKARKKSSRRTARRRTGGRSRRPARAVALSVVHDGKLTEAEALESLAAAAQAATEALPDALDKCKTDADRQKVQTDRDTVVLAYMNALNRSLINTSSQFESLATQLADEAAAVKKRAGTVRNVAEAINLMTDLVRLAASLALAFA